MIAPDKSNSRLGTRAPRLHRTLGFWALVAYGAGDILGAGIYALVGEVAGRAGHWAWLSFGITVVVAGLTACSYAELGRRFPRSGGEAHFCDKAFGRPAISSLIGFLVLASGVVSLATVSHAFVGYVFEPLGIDSPVAAGAGLIVILVALSVINFWGIRQSSIANIVCTVIEAGGLLLVVGAGLSLIVGGDHGPAEGPVAHDVTWLGIFQGSALAFFAFIGFEDMVNVSEEVRNPRRNMPAAIFVALGVAAGLYMLVAWIATAIIPPEQLAASEAPLWEVVRVAAPWMPAWSFPAIAVVAVANTGLLNFIMGSRLLYGMSRDRLAPQWLDAVHSRTRTPHRAILIVLIAAIGLALSGTISMLAGTTNVLLLIVFSTVNVALIVLKRERVAHRPGFTAPLPVPIAGAIVSLALIAFAEWKAILLALAIIVLGSVLVVIHHRPRT